MKELFLKFATELLGKDATNLVEFTEENGTITSVNAANFQKELNSVMETKFEKVKGGQLRGQAYEKREKDQIANLGLTEAEFTGLKGKDYDSKLATHFQNMYGKNTDEATQALMQAKADMLRMEQENAVKLQQREAEIHGSYSKIYEEKFLTEALTKTGRDLVNKDEKALEDLRFNFKREITSAADLVYSNDPQNPAFFLRQKGGSIPIYDGAKELTLVDFANKFLDARPFYVAQSAGSGGAGGNGTPPPPPQNINKGDLYK